MPLLDEIGGKITALGLASSSGANGWTLVKSWLPDSTALPHTVVALTETGGYPPALPVELDYPTFLLRVRGAPITAVAGAYEAAQAEAMTIRNALHGLGGILLPTSSAAGARYYVEVAAQQDPALLHYDGQQRPVLACNFRAIRSRT